MLQAHRVGPVRILARRDRRDAEEKTGNHPGIRVTKPIGRVFANQDAYPHADNPARLPLLYRRFLPYACGLQALL